MAEGPRFRVREKIHLGCLQKIAVARAPVFGGSARENEHLAGLKCGKPSRIGVCSERAIRNSQYYVIVYINIR